MDPHRRQIGFTMVELVTCIVILGILAAAVGPKFIGNQSFSERGYADEVASALRYAQAVAIANGCGVAVTLNANDYQALQPANAGCGGGWKKTVTRLDGGPLAGTAPSGVAFDKTTQITFDGQGRIANTQRVALNDGGFTLWIMPYSGFVTVQ